MCVQGCDKGDKCRFAHIPEDRWGGLDGRADRGPDRGRFLSDRGERREDRERERSQ